MRRREVGVEGGEKGRVAVSIGFGEGAHQANGCEVAATGTCCNLFDAPVDGRPSAGRGDVGRPIHEPRHFGVHMRGARVWLLGVIELAEDFSNPRIEPFKGCVHGVHRAFPFFR